MSMKTNKGGGMMWLFAIVVLVAAAITLFAVRASNPPDFDAGAQSSGVATVGGLMVEGAEIALVRFR